MQLTILVIATCKKGLVRLTTLLDILLLPHQEAVYRFAVLMLLLQVNFVVDTDNAASLATAGSGEVYPIEQQAQPVDSTLTQADAPPQKLTW